MPSREDELLVLSNWIFNQKVLEVKVSYEDKRIDIKAQKNKENYICCDLIAFDWEIHIQYI